MYSTDLFFSGVGTVAAVAAMAAAVSKGPNFFALKILTCNSW